MAVDSSAILVFIYIKMHHILGGSDHNKIRPLQQEEFSNDKRFRNGLEFIDQNLNKAQELRKLLHLIIKYRLKN